MTWKVWLVLVLVAALGGFWKGSSHLGSKAAAQAAAAEQQIKQLGDQVANEMLVRKTKETQLAELQTKQSKSDAIVSGLTKLLAAQNKPTGVPATGPATAPLSPLPAIPEPEPAPLITTATLKDNLIAAQAKDIDDLKAVVLKQSEIIAQDNIIIPQMQKEINLGKIALDAQIAATKAAHVKGIFQGSLGTIGIEGVFFAGSHFIK
jgi:hypothetical protein